MNWIIAFPELVLTLCGLVILTVGVVQKKSTNPFAACSMLTIAAFAITGFLVTVSPDGSGYEHVFVNDGFARFMKVLSLIGGALATIMTLSYRGTSGGGRFELPVLILFSTIGTMLMASSDNMMTLFVGLELSSLAIYILCAFDRDSVVSSESGLKYFILGSLASGLLLYGISLTYGYGGTMEYGAIRTVLIQSGGASLGLMLGIVFLIAGLAFKLSAVPFHMWTPDVYQGAPTPVTAYLAGAPKIATFALILRIMAGPFGALAPQWQLLIEMISVLSMVFGSLAAIPQTNIKRLMAYSSIGHMGYALMGLAAATPGGIRGTLVYLTTYLFMNVGVFAGIAAMRRKGHETTDIADLSGLGRTSPGLALMMAIFMFSMLGMPPTAGFFGKLMVFSAAYGAGLYGLLAIGAITSAIGAYYYLRIVKVMYFDASAPAFDTRSPSLAFLSVSMGIVTALFVLVLGPVTSAAQAAASALIG
ncbi:NADH-quinone oxidoreductase chain N [Ameyamaea chiangmaiensis NBRC 103196]|uniref:NADH-quinone oxidoreductase subunit N n=1 Tax=Ameyamaea chiangmaiensis TaxID=442969 RepID=A0A850PAE8_9PROT|nr:NADH-quinone oxidoreductase subunit NuoN [Ameyamaea chiangmaiensis]MBS4074549.1 NADH-quinone oxidoreductase subunit NuoN [Ameyamaea chiangmaiensis]NVN39510.1 NADH-quinone oxidoreductase subunit NuoN [Ameyamaea chiangmaiensis]GBQ72445.1 NADH-quinone oxidoreductase chain N [Ameyamaea chiangmaiensis NBRC 103196]